ncbi:cysteine--tRNA ligase [bacterium]|nr:cysteine--tRNA ligase [bacterium]
MSLQFFDTRRRKKLPFTPLHDGKVGVYNCGPTIYDFAHIGNFRSYIFTDTLRRWLEVKGFDVLQVMNLTDVDDKTIRRSQEEKLPLNDYTARYREAFFADIDTLNIQRAHVYPEATTHIDVMVELVQNLLDSGNAYKAEDGSIYFSVSSFANYGTLSGKRLEDLRVGERVSSDEYESKDDVRDFALWKAYDEADGDVFWETPFGKGRPGWHLECSAMSTKYLGHDFDIHTGGVDLVFPHHENEIAQSLCGIGGDFAHWWLHNEHLIIEGRKMSKSLGNFYTLRDIIEMGYSPREIRYVLAATHYRSKLNFTFDGLKAARAAIERIDEFHASWATYPEGEAVPEATEAIERAEAGFFSAMDDDLNVSGALAHVFTLIREINALHHEGRATQGLLPQLTELWEKFDHALSLFNPFGEEAADPESERIDALVAERWQARADKNWARADEIRDQLAAEGIELKDGADGTRWKRK